MGNKHDCSKEPKRYIENECHVSMHDFGNVQNFCTLAGPAGTKYRKRVCRDMGPEYGAERQTGGCHYNDCNNMSAMSSGCCKHPARCCGFIGKGAACQRKAFYGDAADCCLRNSICLPVFSEAKQCQDSKEYTCSDGRNKMPNHRELTGGGCRSAMRGYFLGENTDIDTAIARWTDDSSRGIMYFIDRVVHQNANCLEIIDDFALKKDPEGWCTRRS